VVYTLIFTKFIEKLMSIANTQTETIIDAGIIEENDQVLARVEHLKALENLVGNSYPNKYERSRITGEEDTISNLLEYKPVAEIAEEFERHKSGLNEGEKPDQELKARLNEKLKALGNVRISGRLAVPPRVMGKAAFVHLSDGAGRLQIYVRKQDAKAISNDTGNIIETEDAAWELFKLLDHGDFLGAEGFLFLTNTGELSVHVETLQFLSKSLLPMPDKMHGIADPELQRRYRYADLIADSLKIKTQEEIEEEKRTGVKKLTTREVFERRARLISGMRRYLDDHGFIEVETPMLTPKATGAAAKPFATHHNALDIPLYARIAPELYLKRLTVGGFEKVYELNRNFRNEGLSQKHNPEFTMLEFYCAYMDVNGMMDFAEAMIQEAVKKATGGSLQVKYDGKEIDFSRFERLSMKDAIVKYAPKSLLKFMSGSAGLDKSFFDDVVKMGALRDLSSQEASLDRVVMAKNGKETIFVYGEDNIQEKLSEGYEVNELASQELFNFDEKLEKYSSLEGKKEFLDKFTLEIFENIIEEKLIQPTFIIDYPKSISPLSKASPENPQIAERFELFINGMECANGFSELNDPQEQYERFVDQMKERETGDEEAMVLDEDYIRALAYGMPPAAGIGIGIDRLVMLLTNKHSIRDVILFPHMRPERKDEEAEKTNSEK
jgi:lysyl-tRNA synthetase class 2